MKKVLKRISKRISKRIRCSRGESITETLVAVLISSVAMLMLATMIVTSVRLVSKSRDKMNEYYSAGNKIADYSEPIAAGEMVIAYNGDIVFDDTDTGIKEIRENVDYYKNDEIGRKPVLAYSVKTEETEGIVPQDADAGFP